MFPPRTSPGLKPNHLVQRFRQSNTGVAAIEFALIAPVLIIMFLGMTEVTVGVNTDRKLALVTRTLADLTARASTMTSTDMSNVFAAASVVMQPYSASTTKMVVSSILVTTSGSTVTGTVDWSCGGGNGGMPRTKGTPYTVPDSFKSSYSFILVETTMDYTPMFGGQFTGGALTFHEATPWPVRNATQVVWSGSACGA